MKKYKTSYVWLDDFNEAIKVTTYKPSSCYKYKIEKILLFDIVLLEEALF